MRIRYIPAVLFAVTAVIAFGQDPDSAWKELLIQGQRATMDQKPAAAELSLKQALRLAERFGSNDRRVAVTMNALGLVYKDEKKYGEAEKSFRRALEVLDAGGVTETQEVAEMNFNLAGVLVDQGKQQAAIPLYGKSLTILLQETGGRSLRVANVHCALGELYRSMKAWADAEGPLSRCAEIREADGGVVNAGVGDALYSLAIVYEKQGKFDKAEPRYRLVEKIREQTSGITSPGFAQALESHAALLKSMGREQEAAKDMVLAASIRRRAGKPGTSSPKPTP